MAQARMDQVFAKMLAKAGSHTKSPAKELLEKFHQLDWGVVNSHCGLVPPGWAYINRAINPDGTCKENMSNFSVLIKVNPFCIEVCATNPGFSEIEYNLCQGQVQTYFRISSFPDGWTDNIINAANELSGKKPADAHFLELHKHVRWPIDDGSSNIINIARNEVLGNLDFGTISCHNNFDLKLYDMKKAVEAEANIISGPAIELTVPSKEGDRKNCFHIVIVFKNPKIAEEFHNFLHKGRKKVRNPPAAPPVPREELLQMLVQLINDGKIAISLAHPSSHTRIAGKYDVSNSLISEVAMGHMTMEEAMEFVRKYCHMIEMHNPVDSTRAMKFLRDEDKKFIQRLVDKHLQEGWPLSDANNMRALAKELESDGIISVAGHDYHFVHNNMPARYTGGSSAMTNVLTWNTKLGELTSENIINLILSDKAASIIQPFIPLEAIANKLRLIRNKYGIENGLMKTKREIIQTLSFFNVLPGICLDLRDELTDAIGSAIMQYIS